MPETYGKQIRHDVLDNETITTVYIDSVFKRIAFYAKRMLAANKLMHRVEDNEELTKIIRECEVLADSDEGRSVYETTVVGGFYDGLVQRCYSEKDGHTQHKTVLSSVLNEYLK